MQQLGIFLLCWILQVITISITSFVGIFAVAAALEGYLFHHMPWYLRIVSLVGGLMLIYPGAVTDIIGIAMVGLMVLIQFTASKKAAIAK